MSPAIRIRAMQPADLDRVVAIASSLSYAPHWAREVYVKALDPDRSPIRVALAAEEAGGGVAGFAIASVLPPHAELESIAVSAHLHRQGVARRLFAELLINLQPRRVTEIVLEVRESNLPARALYSALGFSQLGTRPRYYADPEENAVLLSFPVGPLQATSPPALKCPSPV